MARPNRDPMHLGKLRDFYRRRDVMPSYAALATLLGFSGKSGAAKLVKRLVDQGFLKFTADGRFAPGDQFFDRPQVDDRLPAGTSDATIMSGSIEHHQIDRLLIDHPSATFLVRVRGNSMQDAGVLDGDTAVVERATSAHPGDFVAAMVDGECTVKELRFECNLPVLVPHSAGLDVIRPQHDLQIMGVVKGIVRKYRQRPGGDASKGRTGS